MFCSWQNWFDRLTRWSHACSMCCACARSPITATCNCSPAPALHLASLPQLPPSTLSPHTFPSHPNTRTHRLSCVADAKTVTRRHTSPHTAICSPAPFAPVTSPPHQLPSTLLPPPITPLPTSVQPSPCPPLNLNAHRPSHVAGARTVMRCCASSHIAAKCSLLTCSVCAPHLHPSPASLNPPQCPPYLPHALPSPNSHPLHRPRRGAGARTAMRCCVSSSTA